MSKLKIKDGDEWIEVPAGGVGVPAGGSAGQYLIKSASTDYATEWADYGKTNMLFPDYSQKTDIYSYFDAYPKSSTTNSYTFPENAEVFFQADRAAQGNTLYVNINNNAIYTIPAHVTFGGTTMTFLVKKGDVLKFTTDTTSNTWILRVVTYCPIS